MKSEIFKSNDYILLLQAIKDRVRNAQIKASVRVNSELMLLYWDLGQKIVEKQTSSKWGDSFIKQLSKDLISEFPEMKGFSLSNLKFIRQWFSFYSQSNLISQQLISQLPKSFKISQENEILENSKLQEKSQQPVSQFEIELKRLLSLVPWGHHIQIISKCKDIEQALFYVLKTIENNWSRSVLVHQIELGLYERQGKIISNFEFTLPKPQSDLALETLKEPYVFDFLTIKEKADEKDIENQLVSHITKFLLELGKGFSFVGNQYHIEVAEKDYYIDLLFFHLNLRCFIVIELKAVEFKPENAGKLNFYLNAFNAGIKAEEDKPTNGLLLCKKASKLVAEYSLKNLINPIGVTEYRLTEELPENLKMDLPSIEDNEREFMDDINSRVDDIDM